MKTLRESILDDEDVLVGRLSKDHKNLITNMIASVDDKISSYEFYKILEKNKCIDF
jgi:hypothetical protein